MNSIDDTAGFMQVKKALKILGFQLEEMGVSDMFLKALFDDGL